MQTFSMVYAIIIDVTPPNTLYSFCYNPIRNEIPSPEKPGYPAGLFTI